MGKKNKEVLIMKQSYQVMSLTLLLLAITGCGLTVVDLTAPTMEVIEYMPVPMEDDICGSVESTVFQLTGGDQLAFDVIFKDNEALSQYKIDIHNNFDCHGHGGGIAPKIIIPSVDSQTEDLAVLDLVEISGTETPASWTIEIPDNVTAGNYHFQIQVLDESGNDNPGANFFALKIKNPTDEIPPIITAEEPSSSSFTAQKGEVIRFKGEVTDERSLSDGGNGILYLSYTDVSSGNTFSTDIAIGFDNTVDNSYLFDFEYTIPQTLVAGDYIISLGANDGVRNVADFLFFEVAVTN